MLSSSRRGWNGWGKFQSIGILFHSVLHGFNTNRSFGSQLHSLSTLKAEFQQPILHTCKEEVLCQIGQFRLVSREQIAFNAISFNLAISWQLDEANWGGVLSYNMEEGWICGTGSLRICCKKSVFYPEYLM